jgi:hypothetical protein
MLKEINKRIEILEAIATAEAVKREESTRILSASIDGNILTLYEAHSRTVTGVSTLAVVLWLEDYIKKTQPQSISINVHISGIAELLPSLAETAEGREVDIWFCVHHGNINGDYTNYINNGTPLANIILLESLLPFLRGSKANEAADITISFTEHTVLSIVDDVEFIIYVLYDRFAKWKAYGEKPKNRFSKYWNDYTAQQSLRD